MTAQIQRWSYSLWSAFKQCPRKVRYSKIDKLPEPPNPAMQRGETIHKKAEHYVKGNIQGVPPELSKLKREFIELKKSKPEHVEEFWGFDYSWKPLRGGFNPAQKFTLKADVAMAPRRGIAVGIDHKTGRIYESHDAQAELTALATLLWYPDARLVAVEFWYVDLGEIVQYEFSNTYLTKRRKFWSAEGDKILNEKRFLPTPSVDACRYCAFRSDKGGPCSAHKQAR